MKKIVIIKEVSLLFLFSLLSFNTFAQPPVESSWSMIMKLEDMRSLPTSAFYDVSAAVIKDKVAPGKLMRSEIAQDFNLPPGISARRILYHSETLSGKATVSSGVVLLPYSEPPSTGWPVIAWAHGTTGVGRACAPSLMENLHYGPHLYQYVLAGYAVVATDYAGMGIDNTHLLGHASNGLDVIHSVTAAHQAISTLDQRWVAIGHSQGGLAAVNVAILQNTIQDKNYLGAIPIDGGGGAGAALGEIAKLSALPPLYVVQGVSSTDAGFDPASILTDEGLEIYPDIVNLCFNQRINLRGYQTNKLFKPDWMDNPEFKQYLSTMDISGKPYGPVLMLTTGNMPAGPNFARVVEFCKQGGSVQHKLYPGFSHYDVLWPSMTAQLQWLRGRFNGEPASNDCPTILSKKG